MKTVKLNEDLSLLTSIPEKTLGKVFSKSIYCISNAVVESTLAGEEVTEIVTDVGSILIQNKDNQLKYKFVPNAKLDRELTEATTSMKSSLEDALEESVIKKFNDLYRELC